MNLLPFEKLELKSSLTENEILTKLKNDVEENTVLGLTFTTNSNKDYEGFVNNNTFKIRRILKSGMNSFIPTVSGIIIENKTGTKIRIKIQLHKVISIFLIVMTMFMGVLLVVSNNSRIETNKMNIEFSQNELFKENLPEDAYKELSATKNFDWLNLLFVVAPYIVTIIFYNHESDLVKIKLNKILGIQNNIC